MSLPVIDFWLWLLAAFITGAWGGIALCRHIVNKGTEID